MVLLGKGAPVGAALSVVLCAMALMPACAAQVRATMPTRADVPTANLDPEPTSRPDAVPHAVPHAEPTPTPAPRPMPEAASPSPALPVTIPDQKWRPLADSVHPVLQVGLEKALAARPTWQALVDRRKLAVGLVDLSDPASPRFARVNGNVMMYAASLPKIAVLLAAYQAFEDGTLEETPELRADLTAMIRTSSNSAATRMIDLVGFDKIAATLRDPRFMLFDADKGGGLWVGKRYAKEGKRRPDPLRGLSHAATATQTCRFYYLLATGRVISVERSRQMLADLADPRLHHKFVNALERRAPNAKLFRKSGTWKHWHSDSVLVWGDVWRRYILVALVESTAGEQIVRELVPVVESLLRP